MLAGYLRGPVLINTSSFRHDFPGRVAFFLPDEIIMDTVILELGKALEINFMFIQGI